MNILNGIYNLLANTSAVTALVSTKIFPLTIPEGTALPAIKFEVLANTPETTKDDVSQIDTWVIDVETHCKNTDDLAAISSAVRTALDRYTGTNSSVVFDQINYKDTDDIFDEESETYIRIDTYHARERR